MSLKIEFVERATKGEKVAVLCREYGVSRTTGHKWINRFKARGYEGLDEESRRPKTTPLATAEDLLIAVFETRQAHPRWGPRKLHLVLAKRFAAQTPSVRTIARILKRANLVRERRRRRPPSVVERAPQVEAKAPNDVWTVDFKGWWRSLDGARCDPLTVRDAHSRFVLDIVVCPQTYADVRKVFERLFRKYGVPRAIQCDNGTPFVAVRARGGLSRLSAWWLSLGVQLVRSRPGCPQDNGGHERMHGDISADVQSHPAATVAAEQRRLSRWRQEFNHVRPHEALGGSVPAEVYKSAAQRLLVPVPFAYPERVSARRVYSDGDVSFRRERIFVSEALAGHVVGLEPVDGLCVRLWFRELDLGVVETTAAVEVSSFDRIATARKRLAS